MPVNGTSPSPVHGTEVLPVSLADITLTPTHSSQSLAHGFSLHLNESSASAANLRRAAAELRSSEIPVAFPTETVYGLGADATRSEAVQGIYKAKNRPSDNPLIVHVDGLDMLRGLLRGRSCSVKGMLQTNGHYSAAANGGNDSNAHNRIQAPLPAGFGATAEDDPIPPIYHPLISRFWAGPLTILLPNPTSSHLSSLVTASLPTFGARMPSHPLALALIHLSGLPLAAPSANASSKPSPTSADHVIHDLNGRIRLIVDGGECEVGVESTVVDGLSNPPAVLRPGGVSIEQLRACPGWENVAVGYRDAGHGDAKGNGEVNGDNEKPRAPGMKYRHYSPKAPVILYEHGRNVPTAEEVRGHSGERKRIGVIRTIAWPTACGIDLVKEKHVNGQVNGTAKKLETGTVAVDDAVTAESRVQTTTATTMATKYRATGGDNFEIWDIALGISPDSIAKGLFSALREFDEKDVDAILVEGIDDSRGDVSAAVMNRLRKAAEVNLR